MICGGVCQIQIAGPFQVATKIQSGLPLFAIKIGQNKPVPFF
jgi:hypothetical protein